LKTGAAFSEHLRCDRFESDRLLGTSGNKADNQITSREGIRHKF
jgi:hypothetical protein